MSEPVRRGRHANVRVLLTAALAFAAGAAVFWGRTHDWGRALSYATGFTAVLIVVELVRVSRGRDDAEPAPKDDDRPTLFGNG